jgi:5'-phosphate synthase pdxT subunit
MDITVRRNVFGRQIDSFLIPISIAALDMISETSEKGVPFPAVFIRAPRIEKAGEDVDTLAMLDDGTIVAARQDNTLVSSFHPELTDDTRFHEYFVAMVTGRV